MILKRVEKGCNLIIKESDLHGKPLTQHLLLLLLWSPWEASGSETKSHENTKFLWEFNIKWLKTVQGIRNEKIIGTQWKQFQSVWGKLNGRASKFVWWYASFPVLTSYKCKMTSLVYSLFSVTLQSVFLFQHLFLQILEISCMPGQMLGRLLMLSLQPLYKPNKEDLQFNNNLLEHFLNQEKH